MDTPQRVTIFIQRQESSSSMIMIWNLICCIYKGEMHGLLLNIMFALAVQINACVRVVYTEVVQTKLKDKWKWKRRPKRQLNVCSWSSLSQTETASFKNLCTTSFFSCWNMWLSSGLTLHAFAELTSLIRYADRPISFIYNCLTTILFLLHFTLAIVREPLNPPSL